jgi:hypothetical protein
MEFVPMKHTKKLVPTNIFWIVLSLFFCGQLWSQDILIPFKKGKLYGYANEAGEMVIAPDFEDAQPFDKNDRAVVVKYGLFGQIDKSGKVLIPCIFPRQFNEDRLFVESESGEKKWLNLEKIWLPAFPNYFIRNRKDGTVLECSTRAKVSIFAFSDNLRGAVEGNFILGMSSIILKDSTVNIIDTSGQFIFQKKYPNISIYSENLFAIGNEEGHIALMNRDEKLLSGFDFDRIYCPFDSPYLKLKLKDQGLTNTPLNKLMDRQGNMIFKNAYPGLDYICGESFAYLPSGQQSWTILDLQEDSVGVLDFNETKYLGSFAAGSKNGQKFLLNKSLEIVDGPFKNLQYNWLLKSIIGHKNDSTYIYLLDNEEPKRFFGPAWSVSQGKYGYR